MTSDILEAGLNKFADNDVLAIVYSKDKPIAMVTFFGRTRYAEEHLLYAKQMTKKEEKKIQQ